MNIIEYNDKYKNEIKNLFVELQEYIVSLDPYHYNVLNDEYADKVFEIDMNEIKDNNGIIYIALDNDRVIGFIMGIIEEPIYEYDFIRNSRVGEVTELIVTKNVRTNGVGKKLLERIEEYFKNNDCKTINIDVFGYNDIAKNFYHKNGYHDRMLTVSKKILDI